MNRKSISLFVLILFLWGQIFGACRVAFAQVDSDKAAVAVADLDATGISKEETYLLSSRLMAEIWKTQKFEVLERQKMDAILQEQGFQLSGACDEASCLLEIGRLLPVEKIIGGSIGKVGNTWTITLRMIDIGSGRIEKTVIRDCFNCTIDEILSPHLSYAAYEMAGLDEEYAEAEPENQSTLTDTGGPRRSKIGDRPITDPDGQPEFGPGAQAVKKGGGSIFGKWWFWVIVAGAGGGVAAAVAGSQSPADESSGGGDNRGTIRINW